MKRNSWCVRVVDGDTLILDVDYPVRKGMRMVETVTVRLMGVNTPEIRDKDIAVRKIALNVKAVVKSLVEGKECEVELVKPDKYGGRWDGHVFLKGRSLALELIEAGHGVPYDGGKR